MPLDFKPCVFYERTCAKHPGSSWNYSERCLSALFFILSLGLSLSFLFLLIRLHRKSELPFVCNGESRKGEGARSTASEEGEEKEKEEEAEERGGMRRVWRVAWEQRKATRRKMQRDGTSIAPFLGPPLSLAYSVSPYFTLCLLLRFPPPFPFLISDLFRASTIYLQTSNKKK